MALFQIKDGLVQGGWMDFCLADLIQPIDGLHDLSRPFSQAEIDKVLKEMPTDRAPGPDGFNGFFLRNDGLLFRRIF